MKLSAPVISASLMAILMLSAVFIIAMGAGSPQLPDISTDASGTWELVGDGANGSLGSSLTLQQDRWLLTGELQDEDNGTSTAIVGVFINRAGTSFMFDLGNDTRRCLVYGLVDGDNMWLGAMGRDGDIFAFRDQYVRNGAALVAFEPFTALQDEYVAISASQANSTQVSNLTGENLSITNQNESLVIGAMEQDVEGTITDRNFTALGVYKDSSGNGDEAEYYIMMDATDFWIVQHDTSTGILSFRTVALSESVGDENQTVVVMRSYVPQGSGTDLSDDPSYIQMPGAWSTVMINIESTGDVQFTGRSVTLDIANQVEDAFFGVMIAPDYQGHIGGSLFSADDSYFFIAGPAVGNAVNLMYGWIDGENMYLFAVFEENGSKVASTEIYRL